MTPNSRNLEFCVVIGEGGPSPGPSAEVESLARGGGRAAHATGRGRPELLNRIQSRGKPQRRRRKASGAIERVHCNKHRAETTANGSVNRPSALWSLAYGITTFFWGARRRPAAGVKWYFFFFSLFPVSTRTQLEAGKPQPTQCAPPAHASQGNVGEAIFAPSLGFGERWLHLRFQPRGEFASGARRLHSMRKPAPPWSRFLDVFHRRSCA